MEVSNPPLTAVAQPVEILAEVAWERLARRLDGAELPPDMLRVPCRLVERASVTAPKKVAAVS